MSMRILQLLDDELTEQDPVGLEDDAEKLIHPLTRETEDLDITSIAGTPGLGRQLWLLRY